MEENSYKPRFCPFCGKEEKVITYMVVWTAISHEESDNVGKLDEHQCADCGLSFWT